MLSLIVSTFEQTRILKVLLECLDLQTYSEPWEVVITDDGSNSDALPTIRCAAAGGNLDIRYVWHPNRGFRLSAARNNAIRLARGDILVFLDGDMLVGPEFIANHASFHDKPSLLVCGTRRTSVLDENCDLRASYRSGSLTYVADGESERQILLSKRQARWKSLIGCNFSLRRAPAATFDENFLGWGCEDSEFAYRLVSKHGYAIKVATSLQATHIRWAVPDDSWNPVANKTRETQTLINSIRNFLYFAALYPQADLSPALDLLRYCHVEPATDALYVDETRPAPTVHSTIPMLREWMARHDVEVLPDRRAGTHSV